MHRYASLSRVRLLLLHPHYFIFMILHHAPRPTLFPYTTLFRSRSGSYQQCWHLFCYFLRSLSLSLSLFPSMFLSLSLCIRSEEHTSELQSHSDLVCCLLLDKKKIATSDE